MWVVYCDQTGVEHNERFEFKHEAQSVKEQLEIEDEEAGWSIFTYSIRLEA